MDKQFDPPRRIDQIAKYLVGLYGDIANTLPPPVIIKGKNGTGRSWVLNLIRQRLEKIDSHNTHIITVPLQLSAKNLVKTIVDQIAADVPNLIMGNNKSGRPIKKKIVLLIDNIDTLLNLTQGDEAISVNERAEVFGDLKKQKDKIIGANISKFQHVQDVSEFRSFLIENANCVTVIASSGENTYFMEDSDQPFFQFFNVIELKPLDVHEVREFIENRCKNNPTGERIFSLLNSINHDWPDVLTEGRVTYAKFVIDAIYELNIELKQNEKSDGEAVLKRMILLFLGKVSPYIEAIIDSLSYSEKKLIDLAVFLPDGFYANNLKGFDGKNISQTLKTLKRKKVIVSDKEGHNARYEFSSSVFKAYLRFHRNALCRDVLWPLKQFSRR